MSENNGLYDMRKKLLQLQDELIKDANTTPKSNSETSPTPPVASQPSTSQSGEVKKETLTDVMSILKELQADHQKITALLVEIFNKLK